MPPVAVVGNLGWGFQVVLPLNRPTPSIYQIGFYRNWDIDWEIGAIAPMKLGGRSLPNDPQHLVSALLKFVSDGLNLYTQPLTG